MLKDLKYKQALAIVTKLRSKGYAAYLVGGTVRDLLLGRTTKDYDIATSAKPAEIEQLFPKTIPVGKQFGVIIVVNGANQFEVATFRADIGSKDARHPDKVTFTSAKKDAQRRDFTINGLFLDPHNNKILDYVEGQKDLQTKTLRFIGAPEERIAEDHLRIMRAVRFKNALGLSYEPSTLKALKKSSKLVKTVSGERLRDELNKILLLPNRYAALLELVDLGLLKAILPEVEAGRGYAHPKKFHGEGDVFAHTLKIIEVLPAKVPLITVWIALLHDLGKPATQHNKIHYPGHDRESAKIAERILKRFHFPKTFIRKATWVIANHMIFYNYPHMRVARRRQLLRHPFFAELLRLFYHDTLASLPPRLDSYNKVLADYKAELALPLPPKLLLNGTEIMRKYKLKPGPKIGKLLKALEDAQLENKVQTKPQAYRFLAKTLEKK